MNELELLKFLRRRYRQSFTFSVEQNFSDCGEYFSRHGVHLTEVTDAYMIGMYER